MDAASSDDDLPLIELPRALWRRKLLIAGCTAVAVAATGAWALSTPPVYESTAMLMLVESRIADVAGPTTAITTYLELFRSRALAAEVIRELALPDITPSRLAGSVFVRQLPNAAFLTVSAESASEDYAIRLANSFAEQGVEMDRDLAQGESIATREVLGAALGEARQELQDLETRLVEVQSQQPSLEVLEKEISTLADFVESVERGRLEIDEATEQQARSGVFERLEAAEQAVLSFELEQQPDVLAAEFSVTLREYRRLTRARAALEQDIEQLGARTAASRAALSEHPPLLVVRDTFAASPALGEALRWLDSDTSLLDLSLERELLNPTYDELQRNTLKWSALLEGRRAELAAVQQASLQVEERLVQLATRRDQNSLTLDRLRRRVDLAESDYTQVFEASTENLTTQREILRELRRDAVAALEQRVATRAARDVESNHLVTEHRLAQSAYEQLSERYSQLAVQVAVSRSSNLRIVDPAVEATRTGRGRRRLVLLGLLGGLLAGSVAALALEFIIPPTRRSPPPYLP